MHEKELHELVVDESTSKTTQIYESDVSGVSNGRRVRDGFPEISLHSPSGTERRVMTGGRNTGTRTIPEDIKHWTGPCHTASSNKEWDWTRKNTTVVRVPE